MAIITLVNPTGRKTAAHRLDLGTTSLYFSYETLIAVETPDQRFRLPNYWGPTTDRHFNEMGCKTFPVLDQDAFDQRVNELKLAG